MKLANGLARAVLAVLVAAFVSPGAAAAQTTLDTCGQTVGGQVMLTADLDCSAAADPFVVFDSPGSLSLGGHTFSGSVYAHVQGLKVIGPGMITGPGDGIYSEGSVLHGPHILVIDGAEISGNAGAGILVAANAGNRPSVTIKGASVANNGSSGIALSTSAACPFLGCIPPSKLRARSATITGNGGSGLSASNVSIRDSTITGNLAGVTLPSEYIQRKLSVRDSAIDDNTINGIRIGSGGKAKVKLVRSSVSGSESGILDQTRDERSKVKLVETTLEGNGYGYHAETAASGSAAGGFGAVRSEISQSSFSGVFAPPGVQVKLANTAVAQSGGGTDCGVTVACADLDTGELPRLTGSATCDSSHVYGSGLPGMTWGVCALD